MEELSEKSLGHALFYPHDHVAVSVIIPAYNAAATIERALGSVRAQVGVGAEVIVIDDASADNTVDVVKAAVAALKNREAAHVHA